MRDGLEKYKAIHFTGIGGISMSALAEILKAKGYKVTGSDSSDSEMVKRLRNRDIDVAVGHRKENIGDNVDLLVYTAAVKGDNPEIISAKEKGIPIVDRAALLGMMLDEYKYPICVSGTHGKTTATAMLFEVFTSTHKKPTVMVGGILNSLGENFYVGTSDYMIAEACEYFDSFLKFYPYCGLILNIEEDHLDYFRNIGHIRESFNRFGKNISGDGVLVINADIDGIEEIVTGVDAKVVTFGLSAGNYHASGVSYDGEGFPTFNVLKNDSSLGEISLGVRGEHNVCNALGVIAVSCEMGIAFEDISSGIKNYSGTGRRYEFKGETHGIKIIDDYAHHPTEIKATLKTAAMDKHGKIYCVFQPHTFSRTKALLNELASSFMDADEVIVLDIYAAREKLDPTIHSTDLVEKIKLNGKNAVYFSNSIEAEKFLFDNCIHGDMLITMGAGNVYLLGEDMLEKDLSTASTV